MSVQPYPYVIMGGELMECDLTEFGTKPVVLDGIKVGWGRDEYLSHTDVATLTIDFLDRSGTLSQQAGSRALIGKPVAVFYTDAPGSSWGACYFQGRITAASAEPAVPDPFNSDPTARAWRVRLTAADKTADLGQIVQGPGMWPRETAINRAVRIRNASFIAGIADWFFYVGHVDSIMWPLDVKGKDNLSLTRDFYMSMGDTYSYLPRENNIRYLHRRAYAMTVRLVQDDDGIVRARASDYTYDNRLYKGIGIQACEVTSDDATEIPTQSAITRAEASWKVVTTNPDDPPDHVTVVWADELPELDWGRRTLTFTSWLGDGLQLDPVILEVLNRGRFEGSVPKHPDVTIDTRRTGGFHSRGEAEAYLEGGETQGVVYVSGSRHAYWQWVTPLYAIIGGTIEYRYPGWVIECKLQACWRTNGATPPTWNGLNRNLLWKSPPDVGALSDSLTWYDAVFLTNGNVYAPTA